MPAVELLCAADRMTLRLRTAAPFTGRIFSLDAPATCEVRGTGQLTTEATFIYQDVSRRRGLSRWGLMAWVGAAQCTMLIAECTYVCGTDVASAEQLHISRL